MKPTIETIKSDKIVDENFEAIKQVLCGNVSLDNMQVRILEGTTNIADTQNLVIHSGSSRPVGWFPLVGDVYIQEISDKYLDIRSTKPQVSYKLLVLFGPAITDSSLKVIGGPNYQNTADSAITEVTQVITPVIRQAIQYQPLAIQTSILPNPCLAAGPPTDGILRVLSDVTYFYVLSSFPTAQLSQLFRIHRTTQVVDYLDLAPNQIQNMAMYNGDIFINRNGAVANTRYIDRIDSSFLVVETWGPIAPSGSIHTTGDMYIDDTYIYFTAGVTTKVSVWLDRVTRAGGAQVDINLAAGMAGSWRIGSIMPAGDALFVVIDSDTTRPSFYVCRIDVPTFTMTDVLTSSKAFNAEVGVYSNGYCYIPVKYSSVHLTAGGTMSYLGGLMRLDTSATYPFTILPLSISSTNDAYFTDTIILNDNYLYMVIPKATSSPTVTEIIRYDLLNDVTVTAFIPLAISGSGGTAGGWINSFAMTDYDGTLLLIRNTLANNDYCNFETATIDMSTYDVVTP